MIEPARGCYVYCVVPSAETLSLDSLSGVEPGSRVAMLRHGDLSAVVSPVRLAEFGSEALKRNLEDLEWLERTARAHDAVLARALASEAVVPLRMCTIFANEQRAGEMLDSQRETLLAALARLRGRAEWSVKLLADPRAMETTARERTSAVAAVGTGETGSRGRAYFARKKLARAANDEAQAEMESAAQAIHARLSERAAEATLLAPQHPDVSGRTGRMVLNGAYLAERSRAPAFVAVAEESAAPYRTRGFELDLTGPWAPYNFVTRGQGPE